MYHSFVLSSWWLETEIVYLLVHQLYIESVIKTDTNTQITQFFYVYFYLNIILKIQHTFYFSLLSIMYFNETYKKNLKKNA